MAEDIVVREIREGDLDRVAALAAKLVRMHHAIDDKRFLCVEPVEKGYRWFFGREMKDPDAVILVAELGGAIAGYAYGCLEERNWNDLLDACGKIHDVWVEDDARAKGLGERLVTETIARLEAKGAPRVVLLTAASNERAQRLFEKLGFRRTMVEMTRG